MYKVRFLTTDRVSGENDCQSKIELTEDKVILTCAATGFETHIRKDRLSSITIEYSLDLTHTALFI